MPSQIQTESTVIVGAGQAASEAAVALRQKGYGGRLLMLGDEAYPPYQRPPLSKAYLSGEAEPQALYLKPATAYEKLGIEIRTGVRVDTARCQGTKNLRSPTGRRKGTTS